MLRVLTADELKGLSECEKLDRMCELNVIEQVANVRHTSVVRNAWAGGAELSVHGWIYNINNGILKDLDICVMGRDV